MGIKDWAWTILASSVTITSALASTLIYAYVRKHKKEEVNKKVLVWLVVGSVLLGLLSGGIYYSIAYKPPIAPDSYSESRITRLGQLFSAYFGPYWPYMFMIFAALLVILLVMLFFYTRNGVTMNVDHHSFIRIQRYLIWFGVIFTLGVAAISSWAFAKYVKEKKEQNKIDGDFVQDNAKFKLYIGIAAFAVLITGAVALGLFYLIRHEIKVHKHKKG